MQGSEGWARRAPVEQLALARSDVDALLAWVTQTYGPQLQAALAFLPPEVHMALLFVAVPQASSGVTVPCTTYALHHSLDLQRLVTRDLTQTSA